MNQIFGYSLSLLLRIVLLVFAPVWVGLSRKRIDFFASSTKRKYMIE